MMSERISNVNDKPSMVSDPATKELIKLVIHARVEDPRAADEIFRAVLAQLSNVSLRAIRHGDKYIATVVDRVIVDRLQQEARAARRMRASGLDGADERQTLHVQLRIAIRWFSSLSLVVSGAVGGYIWVWRLLDLWPQFQGLLQGSASLDVLLTATISTVAVLAGGALGVLAARHGGGK